jgi:Xaa-Pro aminopeptidase
MPDLETMKQRLKRARQAMAEKNIDAMLVSNMLNIRYLSGFTGSTALVLLTPRTATLFTDSRYTIWARAQCPHMKIVQHKKGMYETAMAGIHRGSAKRAGFEADHLTYSLYRRLAKLNRGKGAKLIPATQVVEPLRMIKDAGELRAIRRAAKLTDEAFKHILKRLKPGVREDEVALEMEWFMRKRGGEAAFSFIVASGRNGARPHHDPGPKKLRSGEFVTLDFGAKVDGYCADVTRTVALGRVTKKQRKIYGIVLEAQMRALAAIRAGAQAKEADLAARGHITDSGYGKYFGHGLGHSIGLYVHDGPGFWAKSELVLEPGMVMTVEPGIYIEGWGGVRIEDDVQITRSGHTNLTKSPKELLIL